MKNDTVYLFSDGGVRNNQSKTNIGAYAAILHYKDHKKYISMGFKNVTNNQMELKAVIAGLKAMKRYDLPIEIYSDSAYVVTSLNERVEKWASNGWIKNDGKEVKNKDIWIELFELIKKFEDLKVFKVKAHANNQFNNEVDKLVNDEMDRMT